MKIKIKKFRELSLDELYEILQLRSEVFVVEQNCIYQDVDQKDQKALHVIGFKNNQVIAYTRCFDKGFYFREAGIGRVVVKKGYRKQGYANEILKASIKAIEETYKTGDIKLSAQKYLVKFYEYHQFRQIGKGYLEDGIPHVAMVKTG